MKKKLVILAFISSVIVLPLLAGDSEMKSLNVQQRLRETDLTLALGQYERVKTEAFETSLKLELLSTDDELTDGARKKRAELLSKRYEILQRRADELRATAQKLGEELTVAEAR